jgi:hypothetical protein
MEGAYVRWRYRRLQSGGTYEELVDAAEDLIGILSAEAHAVLDLAPTVKTRLAEQLETIELALVEQREAMSRSAAFRSSCDCRTGCWMSAEEADAALLSNENAIEFRNDATRTEPRDLPPAAAAVVLPVAEREQAERDEEQRQEEDVSAREREDDQRDRDADGKEPQHFRFSRG